MLSRVADSFYWMSRYLERAEHCARVVDVYLGLTLDSDSAEAGSALLASLGVTPTLAAAPRADDDEDAQPEDRLARSDRLDPRCREAVARGIIAARENARQIREHISAEMWERLNRLYLLVREAEREQVWQDEPGAIVRAVVEGSHLFQGITDSTLSHDQGWHYIQIGRFIERATTTAALLEARFKDPSGESLGGEAGTTDYLEWVSLLRACGAFEAYCRHYTADLRPERIAEFLLLNPEFPRSIRFVVDRVEDSLRAVARALGRPSNGRPERFAGRLRAALNYSQIDEIMAENPVKYLENIRKQCEQVHGALYQTYITYSIEAAIAS